MVTQPEDTRDAGMDVVTLGEPLVLLLGEQGLSLTHARSFQREVVGAEVNVAMGMARLGHRVGFLGRVGDDAFGRVVMAELRREGIDISGLSVDPSAPTGLIVRDCPQGRPVEVAYYRAGSAASRLSAADLDPGHVDRAHLLHLTGITPVLSTSCEEATLAAASMAGEAGTLVSFDINLRRRLCSPERARDVLRPLVAQAQLVLAGMDEAELISGRQGRQAVADYFLEHGATAVVIKEGARGSWATDGATVVEQEAPSVHVVDPVGAGDAYAAGFLSSWLRGGDLRDAVSLATLIAASVVQTAGDTRGLPSAAEIQVLRGQHDDVSR